MRVAARAAAKASGGGGEKQAWYEQLIKGGGKVSLVYCIAGNAVGGQMLCKRASQKRHDAFHSRYFPQNARPTKVDT